ncbi:MAG: 2'-5' RNA ligase family protein [Candidatus Riflebacteria bacterium]|nr:2'-5' RNA ligase family protein [Candidatus Riflebacteria bacterium]
MNCHPRNRLPFTLAFRLPEEGLRLLACYHRRLSGFCREFDPHESAHLTVKYLGYESPGFTEADAVALVPELARISRPFLPIQVCVRGIDIFVTNEERKEAVVFLKVLSGERLHDLHETIVGQLGERLEAFPHADGPNFVPHITISKNLQNYDHDRIARLIHRSRKTAKRHFKLDDLVLFTPRAIYPLFPRRIGNPRLP